MAWKFVVKNVHFVGIGGVGMSGIAEVMMNLGYHVTGSDIAESDTTRHLAEMGATIWLVSRRRSRRSCDFLRSS